MTKPIHVQVAEQCATMYRGYRSPALIVFNSEGERLAMYHNHQNALDFQAKTYMGIPYRTDPRQAEQVKVLDEQQVEGGVRLEVNLALDPVADRAPTNAVVIGRALSKPQLCDIITAYAEAHRGDIFARLLLDTVRSHGRFE